MDRQNPTTNGKSNTAHIGTHNETHTHKKEERIKRGTNKEDAIKPINKTYK